MTLIKSLKRRAGLIVSGAASFLVGVSGVRLASGEPLLQPRANVGIAIGVAMVAVFFVLNDTRGGAE